jgi:hypothetical protein
MFTQKLPRYLSLAFAAAVAFSACEHKKTAAELQAEKVKAFQEQQKIKAAIAYHKLIERYPDSPYAEQAKQRLAAMGPVATPKPTPKASK